MTAFFQAALLLVAVVSAGNHPSRNPQLACPPERWHLVGGPSRESCRSVGECPMSCPSPSSYCVDLSTHEYCGETRFGKEYLCFCPNN